VSVGRHQVDFLVSVWGDWHLEMLERVMLPSFLCQANLPTLLRTCDARLSVFTRRSDEARIQALPGFRRLARLLPCEVHVGTEDAEPDASQHITWWHGASRAARQRGACVIVLHPDVLWSAGSIPNILQALVRGNHAVLMPPNLRVVSETLLPELAQRAEAPQGLLSVAPNDLVRLGVRHLHPLSALALDGSRDSLPALEHLWPVAG